MGDHVFIGKGSWLQALGHAASSCAVVINISDQVSISGDCTIVAAESVIIETGVLIGRFVHISDHKHEYSHLHMHIKDQGLAGTAPVRICEGAWLGQGVVICPGVTIGRNSVVGANSVVRHDVPDYCVVAGSPARMLRFITSNEDIMQ